MMYSKKDLDVDIQDIHDKLAEIRNNKGHDYANDEDVLSNIRTFGYLGALVRVHDKVQRLTQLYKKKKAKVLDESVEDTILDLINYSYFMLILYREETE